MKLKFQADANLHPAIVRGLRRSERAVDIQLASGIIPDGTPDAGVLRISADEGRVLVTADVRTMALPLGTRLV